MLIKFIFLWIALTSNLMAAYRCDIETITQLDKNGDFNEICTSITELQKKFPELDYQFRVRELYLAKELLSEITSRLTDYQPNKSLFSEKLLCVVCDGRVVSHDDGNFFDCKHGIHFQCFRGAIHITREDGSTDYLKCFDPSCSQKKNRWASAKTIAASCETYLDILHIVKIILQNSPALFCIDCESDFLHFKSLSLHCDTCGKNKCQTCYHDKHPTNSPCEQTEKSESILPILRKLPYKDYSSWGCCPHCLYLLNKSAGCDHFRCGNKNIINKQLGCGNSFQWSKRIQVHQIILAPRLVKEQMTWFEYFYHLFTWQGCCQD